MTLRPYLLGAVALSFAALVAWDYWPTATNGPSGATGQAGGAQNTASGKPEQIPTLNPLSKLTDTDFAALFDHPLFDPARSKPAVEAPPPEAAPVPVVTETPVPDQPAGPARPVLMGTVTTPWPGGAYLGDDAGGPVVFLRPGQASQGLHLEEVHSDSALFMGPQGEVTLRLQATQTPDEGAPASDAPLPVMPTTMPANP